MKMKQETRDKRNLLKNGICWSGADAFTTPFLIPFGLALGATKFVIGAISALQYLGMLLSQIPGSEAVWVFKKRRLLNNVCELFAKTSWLLIAIIPFLPSDSWLSILLLSVFLSSFFSNFAYPAWASFVAEIIPKNIRGRYFANRNVYMGLISIVVTLMVGFYLDLFPKGDMLGFSSIFFFGFIVGMFAIFYFSKIKGTKLKLPQHRLMDYFHIKGNFRRFLEFNAFFAFAHMIASPFFAVYMLENLKMDYAAYVMFAAITAFAGLASQRQWGKIIDRLGEKPTLTLCVVGAAIMPLPYLLINEYNLIWLIPVQVMGGFVWAGMGLATFAMFLDTTRNENRLVQTAEYNMISTTPMIVAPLVGGLLAENVSFMLSGIPLVFVTASILRFSSLLLLRRVKEPHVKRDYPAERVFRMFVTIHPAKGFAHQIKVIDKAIHRIRRKL